MKKYLLLTVLFVALPLVAYQVGQANRANFGAAAQQQPTVQTNGYRSFTNSNHQWRQGVQTQPVRTSVAGSSSQVSESEEKEDRVMNVGKQAAALNTTATKSATPQAPAAPAQPSSGTVAMPANADPAALLQQVQGMAGMPDMSALLGGNGQQQQGTNGQNAPAMPAGMPDISALMGGMMPAMPGAAPAKK